MAGAQDNLVSLDQAGAMIAERKIHSLAGSHSVNSPMALIRAAIRAGASGLSIIPPVTTSIASDLLIAAGAVDTIAAGASSIAVAIDAAAAGRGVGVTALRGLVLDGSGQSKVSSSALRAPRGENR